MISRQIVTTVVSAVLLASLHLSAQAPPTSAISGIVVDQTGGVLVGARVDLLNSSDTPANTVTTDPSGAFRFEGVAPGTYNVRTVLDGFRLTNVRIAVGNNTSARPLRVTMPLASVQQEITVSNLPGERDAFGERRDWRHAVVRGAVQRNAGCRSLQ